ncbi:uncharacterized protein PHALS_15099 [Plasmopara halstedii]|uniref:Uncharacterized protein n=1 Tax=Plasmopara halstedii TaxID=4781 RepID=A0A0P1B209_PLAHL|nr:uncharacterized protein PHALS_15099 [Plasmopara halstedii]CEG48039.1 hypothetical protein PHALS_15099 [Plasmopara halstedii]|eukprot:XP_024584408.1 hypothetical protein PHALS_15099 [Plasmopara halstedii]
MSRKNCCTVRQKRLRPFHAGLCGEVSRQCYKYPKQKFFCMWIAYYELIGISLLKVLSNLIFKM